MASENTNSATYKKKRWKSTIDKKHWLIILATIFSLFILIGLIEILDLSHFLRGENARPTDWIKFTTEMSAIVLVGLSSGFLQRMAGLKRQRVEETLKREHDIYQSILETANCLIFCLDSEAKIMVFNQECERVTGYRREEVLGKSWPELFLPPEHRHPQLKSFAQWVFAHPCDRYEGPILTKSGEIRTILWSNTSILGSDESEVVAIAIGYDITERKRSEEELISERGKLETVTQNIGVGLAIISRDYRTIWANQVLRRIFGEVEGKICYCTYNQRTEVCPSCGVKEIFEKGIDQAVHEQSGKDKDGNLIWSQIVTTSIRDQRGNITAALEVVVPITERKRAEEEIRSLSKFPSENPNPVLRLDPDGIILYANQASQALLEDWGCEVNGYAPLFWRDLVTDAFKNNSKKTVDVECDEQVYSFLIIPITDAGYVNLYGRDITERKKAEEALQVSHHFLEIANWHTEMPSLLQEFAVEVQNFTGAAAVGLRILGEEGNIPYQAYEGFSREFYDLESPLSTKSDQCMCINVIKGVTDPNLPFYTEGGSFYMNGTTRFLASVSEEMKGRTRNACNQFGYESVALVPILLGERILGLIHVADPHENMFPLEMVKVLEGAAMQVGIAIQRVWSEEEIKKKNKELEAFVYMVSHDLKNPVVSIQGFCSSILKNQRDQLNEKTLFYLQRVQANASLMSSLLEDLVELSRIGRIEDKKTEISVQGVIKSVWAGVSTSLTTQDVEFVCPENLPQVLYSEKRLYQIFSNLLSNALKFRDEDRKTKVEIGHQEDKDIYTFFVRDNGIGIEQKYHNKIFESFSQLKDTKSEGTGMGLAIVKRIVEANQGKVWVESQKGAGSTFYFTIPKNV